MGDFNEWHTFNKWVEANTEYDYDKRAPLGMDGLLEEHINAYSYFKNVNDTKGFKQLDLLIAIKIIK